MTNWRDLGDTTPETYRAEFARLGSPMLAEAEAIYEAAVPHSRLCLAMLWVEQKHATLSTIPADRRNPLSLARPNGTPTDGDERWERYATWAAGVAAWKERIMSATYKGGIYARTATLDELVGVYAPPSENDSGRYVRLLVERMALMPRTETPPMPTATPTKPKTHNMTRGLIPMPPQGRMIATGKIENHGMNRLGPRRFLGVCWHRGLTGPQSLEDAVDWLLRPTTAGLTDGYVSHVDGRAIRMIAEPGGDPKGDMTPWAQGPFIHAAASQDARNFVDRYAGQSGMGVSVWNGWIESWEITGDYWTPISEATKRTIVRVNASRAHDIGVKCDEYPIAPSGLSVLYSHREGCGVAYKECAGGVVWAYINSDEHIEAVRALMAHYQLGAATPEIPATPLPPAASYAPVVKRVFLADATPEPVEEENGARWYLVTDQYRATQTTGRFQRCSLGAAKVGPDMRTGEDASISFVTTAGDGRLWGLSNYGTCFFLDHFERVSDLPAKA